MGIKQWFEKIAAPLAPKSKSSGKELESEKGTASQEEPKTDKKLKIG